LTLRSDHIAGAALAAFGILVLAVSGDLPVGTLAFPGAGMMPKLCACLLVVFGLVVVLRANESVPVASLSWQDLPHALRVLAVSAAAVLVYQMLGFLITMTLMLFALVYGVERRPLLRAASFSIGVVALTYALFAIALKTPLEHGLIPY
jgi:putative tricarboxylic transport membrane protein